MLPRTPPGDGPHVTDLAALLREGEEAWTRRELTAFDREAQGADSSALRQGLQGSRPVMGTLRIMRLQLLAERWRGHGDALDG